MISKKKLLMLLMLIGVLAITVSCSSSKDDRDDKDEKTEKDYLVKLSEADIDKDHIKLELNKNVTVDADITPISKYKDGIDSYYTKYVGGNNEITYKDYKKTPVFLNYPVKDLMKIIEDNSGGKFTANDITIDEKDDSDAFSGEVSFLDKDKKNGSLRCWIEIDTNHKKTGKKHKILTEALYFTSCYADWDKEGKTSDSVSTISLGQELSLNQTGFDEADLPFGTKADIGEKMSKLVKEITKTENYNDYRCVVLNEKTFSYVFENVSAYKDMTLKPLEKECYIYFFPYKIGDFEWKTSEGVSFFSDLNENEGLKFADDVAFLYDEVFPLNASEQIVACNEDGITELSLYNTIEVTDKCKEKQKVLPLNDVVNIIQEYFNSKAPLTTNIYNIKLCYTGDFSSPEDGEIRNIAKPYWCVEYTQHGTSSDTFGGLFIDVSTGDVYD